jgi:Restriction endonuclease
MDVEGAPAQVRGLQFEREVAAIFRALGAEVELNIGIAGSQIDILVKERTPSGVIIRSAVETKFYTRPVGVDVVNAFSAVALLLKQRGLIERAILVAKAGFTQAARSAAESHGLELLEFADLRQRASAQQSAVETARRSLELEEKAASREKMNRPPRIFVLMPFAEAFVDVYVLGIRESAEKLGYIVERADDIEHNGDILEVIYDRIRSADAVVADTTHCDPNVFYEIGYAHALGRPTILITRAGEILPFDLQS